MKKYLLTILSVIFVSLIYSQGKTTAIVLSCDEIGNEIISDSTLNLWSYPNLKALDYHCLGQYFAKWDIKHGNYIIQTYGSPEYQNICKLCNYDSLNISFHYHFDIMQEEITEFILGYNEVSKSFLKKKYDENILQSLDLIDTNKITPQRIFDIIKQDRKRSFLNTSIVNDTLINVKMNLDSISKELRVDLSSVVITVIDEIYKTASKSLSTSEFKNNGVILRERSNNKYYLSFTFDFSTIQNICQCENVNHYYNKLTIPITVNTK